MSSGAKKSKKKRQEPKKEVKKDLPPQVVTCALADNLYSGIIKQSQLGAQYLECDTAKYSWKSGLKYEGPFVQSQIEGRGKFLWPDGSVYEGELRGGKRHGAGVYTGSDGVSRYEGQWRMGQRHGQGKLRYNIEGTSFYDGSWVDGKKHGHGKQLWPSGNTYEGQWVSSKMVGEGTMTWLTPGGGSEQYKGHWEDSHPHGEGTHTWYATPPLNDQPMGMIFMQQQQMCNRYKGQWVQGKREGVGTFYYANGSYYHGEWKDHVKQGHGRHIFEDGRMYEGPFESDRMVEHDPSRVSTVPSPGSEENFICRWVDISDLGGALLPQDASGLPPTAGTGYTERTKILREVYNMLQRYLSELREIYKRYRLQHQVQCEDPVVLSAFQFWLFARDAGLVSPACPLARVNRALFSGPRYHQEVAPEDMHDLRPLTPRQAERPKIQERRDSVVSDSRAVRITAEFNRTSSCNPSVPPSQAGGSDDESSEGSETTSRPNTSGRASQAVEPEVPERSASPLRRCKSKEVTGGGDEPEGGALGRQFQRASGDSGGLADIHAPTGQVVFRQFLEGAVRLSLVRFPNEPGLESQMQRFFRELIEPMKNKTPSSDHNFDFYVRKDFQATLREFEPTLWQLFHNISRQGPEGHGEAPEGPGAGRCGRGDFGAPCRRFHVRARHDRSVRVKDVLKLLDALGLLRPMRGSRFPGEAPFVPVFPGPGGGEEDSAAAGACPAAGGGSVASAVPVNASRRSSWIAAGIKRPTPRKASTKKGSKEAPLPEEFTQLDLRVTPLQVLKALLGVMSPQSAELLCWQLPPEECPPVDQCTALLDYLEMELLFIEFLRLLVRVTDVVTSSSAELCERMPLSKRFDIFLRFVLTPAIHRPYVPPPPPPPPLAPETAAADEQPPAAEPPEAEAAAPTEDGSAQEASDGAEGNTEEAGREAEKEPVDAPIDMWPGFDDSCIHAPCKWPEAYMQEVLNW